MQQLKLNEDEIEITEPRKPFWRRQFQINSTTGQKKFDWFFGVIMPVICFVFDPIVFKTSAGSNLLGTYKPFAYLLSFAAVMGMSAWLIWGAKLKWINSFLAGFFLVCGIISLGIGIVIFPFSLIGLIVLIGALGFTPLFTSMVFFRNALRSFQTAKPFLEKGILTRAFALSAVFSVVIPAVINVEIIKLIDEMKTADAPTIRKNAQILKYVSPIVDLDKIISLYRRAAPDQIETEEMKAIAEAYKRLKGENIETKSRIGALEY